jgi:CRP-like cAMP-binding protein
MIPAQLYIDTLEDCELEIISRANEAEDEISKEIIANIGVEKLMNRISVLQRRVIMLMSATALERYNDFLETYPNIVQRVPQKMIASYLGITPEALSKIRGQKAKTKL